MYDVIVLAGGATKGLSQLGALQYLFDQNMIVPEHVRMFSCVSVGSMIAYLLIIGYTPIEIMVYLVSHSVLEKIKRNRILDVLYDCGLYNWEITVETSLVEMSKEKGIEKIPTLGEIYKQKGIEFICLTTNLTKQKIELLGPHTHPDMDCLQAIRMSCNLPFVFGNYEYKGNNYCDGGILNNFPIDVTFPINAKVIGITFELIPSGEDTCGHESGNTLNILDKVYRILSLPINCREYEKMNKTSLLYDIIELGLEGTQIGSLYNFSLGTNQKVELFSYGYNISKEYFLRKEQFPYFHLYNTMD